MSKGVGAFSQVENSMNWEDLCLVLREREIVRVKGIRGTEIKTGAILLDQAMEHGLYVAPNSGAIRC